MKKLLLPGLFIAFSLLSCRSLHVRDFHSKESLSNRLPKLGLLLHEPSFLDAFDGALDRDVVVVHHGGGPFGPEPWIAYEVTNVSLKDAFHVLGNEMEDNLNQASGTYYGHARFKLLFYNRRNSGWGWTVASISTFLLPNILGMPAGTCRAELELQMEIVDADGKRLVQYIAPGVGKAIVAPYYGYHIPTATRKANLVALKKAMSTIKKKLETDAASLKNQLESTGTLRKLDGK